MLLVQVSIAKQLKSTLGIEDSTKIGFLVHVSAFSSNDVSAPWWFFVKELFTCLKCDYRDSTVLVYTDLLLWSGRVLF